MVKTSSFLARFSAAVFLTAVTALAAAQITTPATSAPAGEVDTMALPPGAPTNAEPQRAAPPRKAPHGEVLPTAAGGRGGATSATENPPLKQEALAEIRRTQWGQPEFRGAWVTRFDWVARSRESGFSAGETKQRIVRFLDNARDLSLNAVVWQVRADCTTLYPSQLEPWSQQVDGQDPGFDPVKMAIEEAHKRGLEFHAYINPIPCTEERTSAPASRDHVWYKHCTPAGRPRSRGHAPLRT